MRKAIVCLAFMLLSLRAEALTLPVRIWASVDEEGKERITLSFGAGTHFKMWAGYSESRQFVRPELVFKPFRIWYEEPEGDYGITMSSKLWDRLRLTLGWRADESFRLYSNYRLSHRWSIGLSGDAYKKQVTGRVFVSYGIDLADYLPGSWREEREREIEWEEFGEPAP